MKNLKIIFQLIALLMFVACQKDDKVGGNLIICKVHVQKITNGESIYNYELGFRKIKFFKENGSTQGAILQDTVLLTAKTNTYGDASFLVPINLLQNDTNIFYVIGGKENLNDSFPNGKNNNWNFKVPNDNQVYYKGEQKLFNFTLNLISNLNCPATIVLGKDDWNINGMDSLIISSNIVNHYNYNNPPSNIGSQYLIDWVRDCNKSNTITYYYYSMGKKSKEFSIQIDALKNTFVLYFN